MSNSDWAAKAFEAAYPTPSVPVLVDLDAPDTWPSKVWAAFYKANSDRIQANIDANETRRVGQVGAHIV